MNDLFDSASLDGGIRRRFPWIADGLAFGGDYSPEQWPEEVWLEDIELMKTANVTSVNVGIFSWGLIEVADQQYDFGWLDRILDLLAEAGIGVNLATPTAAPPSWLLREHPEILRVDERGVRVSSGGRLGWSASSALFREYALRIVEVLATRYAKHPALRMWHVSNELGNENAKCFSDETAVAWQRWLARRFETIDELNRAWGTAFWGHHYTAFEQILPPRFSGTSHNPGLLLDFERFSSDALLEHYRAERDLLRRLTPDIPITTNFMMQNEPNGIDYAGWADEVDLVANDHYTIGADPERWSELSFSADRTRGTAHGAPWLLIEHSTSAVNWQPRNRAKSPGELLRNSLAHIARGADGALFFQWRASTAGSEQFHSAVVPHAGRESKIFREATELGRVLKAIGEIRGSRVEQAQVAMFVDFDAAMALRSGAKPTGLAAIDVALAMYRELTARGVAVDILRPRESIDDYRLVIVPTLYLADGGTASALERFTRAGGEVIVTYFSGIVDRHNRVLDGPYPGAFRDLLGVSVEEFFPLQDGERTSLSNGWTGDVWTERLAATTSTVLARYADGDNAGLPAVTANRVGDGTAVYVSTRLDRASIGLLLDDAIVRAGIRPVAEGDSGLERVRRVSESGSWLFAINHGTGTKRLDASGTDLVSGEPFAGEVRPGAVVVIREDRAAQAPSVSPIERSQS